MKQIPLTQGKFTIVDDEDYDYLMQWKWYAAGRGAYFYAVHEASCVKIAMHRLLLGCPKGLVVDHVNGNGLDNRRSNIRIATTSQNNRNCRRRIDNTSLFKGVHFRSDRNKWRAYIRVNGHRIYLGYHDTAEQAASKYNDAAQRYFGEFALLNDLL